MWVDSRRQDEDQSEDPREAHGKHLRNHRVRSLELVAKVAQGGLQEEEHPHGSQV